MCVGLSLGMSTPRIRGIVLPYLPAGLPLALLVPGVGADDVQPAVPPHELAVLADPLDARPHLHGPTPAGPCLRPEKLANRLYSSARLPRQGGLADSPRPRPGRHAFATLSGG